MSTAAAMVSSVAEHVSRRQGGVDLGARETHRHAERPAGSWQISEEGVRQRGHCWEQLWEI